MGTRYDGTGVDASGGFPIIEKEGWYPFRIVSATQGKSKSGAFQVTVDCACLDPRWRDYIVRHWVTFLPKEQKGAGMALHFLKCIGQPHEGVIDIEPMEWERKTFMGNVVISEYEGKKNNKLAAVSPIKDDLPEFGEPAPTQKTAFEE
jgi:hypothetical protein